MIQQPRRRAVTGRALVLGTSVVVLLVLLASPLHRYFNSRSDVGHAAQQLQSDQKQLRDLQAQQRRWSDPGYIQQQARLRLMYAMPGDTVYVVVNPGQKSDIEKTATGPAATVSATWNQKLWQSVQAAGR
jgi:cell division protein FtsB